MEYIYRYTDLADNIIKYVGIVWSGNGKLLRRLQQHENNDEWCYLRNWKIEYIEEGISTRTDAEYFESHYISLYGTDNFFNVRKAGWGVSNYLPNRENDWIEYDIKNIKRKKIKNTNNNFDLQVYLENMVGQTMLTHNDRMPFVNDLNIKRKGKLIKSAKALNELFRSEYKIPYHIKVFVTSRRWKDEHGETHKKSYNNAWKIERI